MIQPTPESSYTPEADIPYYDVVDTMGDDILEAMEWKNGKICIESNSSCVEGYEIDDDT